MGNHPNILLYASRFQLAKSVDLYHVSDSKSSTFQVETIAYGKSQFQLENHFTSVPHLIEAMTKSNEHPNPIFDLIILNASSLQEISSLASQLNPTININTKVFLESSGFVQLEPFVKMSMDLPNLNIFSIVTDIDFRKIGNNDYKQFSTGKSGSRKNSIYLGDSSLSKVKQTQQNQQQSNSKSSATNSSSSSNTQSTKYPKSMIALLDTFQRLFKKLFPQDEVSLCNYSSLEFLSQEWSLAIPRVCFDPLLILLEETNPAELKNQILAKPLISGLVTEIITVMKSMGSKLNGNLENESSLLSTWERMYAGSKEVPSLVYHFINRTAPLNIDMLLLQPILLADDYGIKTPYLEFLYSLMCQYEKLNEGSSKWFTRKEDTQNLKNQISSLSEETTTLQSRVIALQKESEQKDISLGQLQTNEQSSRNQVHVLQDQIVSLKEEINVVTKKYQLEAQQLKQQELQRSAISNGESRPANRQNGNFSFESHDYAATGTPNLKDIEDFALINVNYGETSQKEERQKQFLQQPAVPLSFGSSHSSGSGSVSGSGSGPEADNWLKERELEIRKKELDLQERELELERRRVQQPQQPQHHPRYNKGKKQNATHATSPTLSTRKASFPQLQQIPNGRAPKAIHGAAAGQATSAANFMDPLGPPMAMKSNPGYANQPSNFHQSHSIKPTSRKNRNSKMPLIGNASSLGLHDYGRSSANGQPPRLNSLSTGNLAMQGRVRQSSGLAVNTLNNGSNPRLNMPNPIKLAHSDSNIQSQDFQSQRQFSSSTTILDGNRMNPNISTNSVVHNPLGQSNGHVEPEQRGQPIEQQPTDPLLTEQNLPPSPALPQGPLEEQAQPPQIMISTPQSSPALSTASGVQPTQTNEAEEETKENKKDKKKKFGLFGKKKKSKK